MAKRFSPEEIAELKRQIAAATTATEPQLHSWLFGELLAAMTEGGLNAPGMVDSLISVVWEVADTQEHDFLHPGG